jgi:hypothetical protein
MSPVIVHVSPPSLEIRTPSSPPTARRGGAGGRAGAIARARVATDDLHRASTIQFAPWSSLRTTRPPWYCPASDAQIRPGTFGSAINPVAM